MSSKTASRRQRRRKLSARFAGADAAERGVLLAENPYPIDSELSQAWLVGYAFKLSDILNAEPPAVTI